MHFIWMLIIGLVAGALAKAVMPGRQGGGVIVTMLLGVAGAFAMGFIGRSVGWYAYGDGPGLIGSTVGAIVGLAICGLVTRNASRPALPR